MKRRSFLKFLGVAPVAAVAVPVGARALRRPSSKFVKMADVEAMNDRVTALTLERMERLANPPIVMRRSHPEFLRSAKAYCRAEDDMILKVLSA